MDRRSWRVGGGWCMVFGGWCMMIQSCLNILVSCWDHLGTVFLSFGVMMVVNAWEISLEFLMNFQRILGEFFLNFWWIVGEFLMNFWRIPGDCLVICCWNTMEITNFLDVLKTLVKNVVNLSGESNTWCQSCVYVIGVTVFLCLYKNHLKFSWDSQCFPPWFSPGFSLGFAPEGGRRGLRRGGG